VRKRGKVPLTPAVELPPRKDCDTRTPVPLYGRVRIKKPSNQALERIPNSAADADQPGSRNFSRNP